MEDIELKAVKDFLNHCEEWVEKELEQLEEPYEEHLATFA